MSSQSSTTDSAGASDEWKDLTDLSLAGSRTCDEIFRPTSFWGPGVEMLLAEMAVRGLQSFKSWPQASFWFYPLYGNGFTNASIKEITAFAVEVHSETNPAFVAGHLSGGWEARRDFDAVRLAWDQERWPFDLESFGESLVGCPRQRYRLTNRDDIAWGRAYLNYLLCLAGLSRHVTRPPRRFLEIGGGFGVLGEIVMSRDPEAVYVDFDIPPLLTVASYYLTSIFGKARIATFNGVAPGKYGDLSCERSAVLPNWRIDEPVGEFDVFVNSFSFQEMEPNVVERYAAAVSAKGVTYVVSLNSREGKRRATVEDSIGVLDPVTSSRISDIFSRLGYQLVGQYGSPLLRGAGELIVLKRRDFPNTFEGR